MTQLKYCSVGSSVSAKLVTPIVIVFASAAHTGAADASEIVISPASAAAQIFFAIMFFIYFLL